MFLTIVLCLAIANAACTGTAQPNSYCVAPSSTPPPQDMGTQPDKAACAKACAAKKTLGCCSYKKAESCVLIPGKKQTAIAADILATIAAVDYTATDMTAGAKEADPYTGAMVDGSTCADISFPNAKEESACMGTSGCGSVPSAGCCQFEKKKTKCTFIPGGTVKTEGDGTSDSAETSLRAQESGENGSWVIKALMCTTGMAMQNQVAVSADDATCFGWETVGLVAIASSVATYLLTKTSKGQSIEVPLLTTDIDEI